jgi:hypothetical protein
MSQRLGSLRNKSQSTGRPKLRSQGGMLGANNLPKLKLEGLYGAGNLYNAHQSTRNQKLKMS